MRLQYFQRATDHARRAGLREQRRGAPAQGVEVGVGRDQRRRRQAEVGKEFGRVEGQGGALLVDGVALLGNANGRIEQVELVGRLLLDPRPGVCQVALGECQALLSHPQRRRPLAECQERLRDRQRHVVARAPQAHAGQAKLITAIRKRQRGRRKPRFGQQILRNRQAVRIDQAVADRIGAVEICLAGIAAGNLHAPRQG